MVQEIWIDKNHRGESYLDCDDQLCHLDVNGDCKTLKKSVKKQKSGKLQSVVLSCKIFWCVYLVSR